MERRKPVSDAWKEFEKQWSGSNHKQKVELARKHGVTWDTAKHWVSEGDTTPNNITVSEEVIDEALVDKQEVIDDIISMKSSVNLDFVTFDIETSNLEADFSIILSAVIKPCCEKEPVVFRADSYPSWLEERSWDERIVRDITTELSKHAIVVTHYGSKFDLRYLRAKAMRYGLPPLPPMFGVDTFKIAKANCAVSSRRLKAIARWFELGSKTEVEGALWLGASLNGDKKAMDKIVEHNIQDCVVLERLASLMFPYLKSIPRL